MSVTIFISYAAEDIWLLKALESHLALLRNQRIITTWHKRDISAGTAWEREIDIHLNRAHLILLLVSADFLASDYCYSVEMKRAMERQNAGEARVLPLLLRPVDWEHAPFSKLQMLPVGGKPVTSWAGKSGLDQAFLHITQEIKKTIRETMIQHQPRTIRLFGYETQKGRNSVLWANPGSFSLTDSYLDWLGEKRNLTEKEIVNHIWIKAGDSGNFSTFHFLPHGLLHEHPFLNAPTPLQGSWELNNGILRTHLEPDEGGLSVAYELAIFASRNGPAHSGIESNNRQTDHAYFVLLPSQQPTKRLEEALVAYEHLLEVNPTCAEAYKAKGNLLRDLGRAEEALSAYQRAIEIRPDYLWAWYDSGEILHKLGHLEDALSALDWALALDDNHAQIWYEKGQTLHDLGRSEEALSAYERATQLNPTMTWYWYRKGEILRKLRRYQEALAAHEQALEVDPTFAASYNERGNIFYRCLKQYEEAIQAYQRATELEPDYKWAWHNLGNVLHELHRFEPALQAYKRTTEIEPGYFWAWHNLGDVFHELGCLEEAIAAFDQAIQRDQQIAATWRKKGKTLQALKHYQEALSSYLRALDLGGPSASLWTRMGEVLHELRRDKEALEAYEQALQLDVYAIEAILGKGGVYLVLERYQEALLVYQQGTTVVPNNMWVWYGKGVALAKLGRVEEALTAFDQAIELFPDNRWAWAEKAKLLEDLVQQARSKARWQGADLVLTPPPSYPIPAPDDSLFDGRNILQATAIKTAPPGTDFVYATFWARFGSSSQDGERVFQEGSPRTDIVWDGVWERVIENGEETLVMDTSEYVNVVTTRRDPLTGAYFCLEYQKDASSPDGKRPTGVRYLFWFVS